MGDRNEPLHQIKSRRDSALAAMVTGVPYMTWLGIRFDRRGDELTAVMPFDDEAHAVEGVLDYGELVETWTEMAAAVGEIEEPLVNAAFDTVFPQKNTTRARLELVQRLRERISVRDS